MGLASYPLFVGLYIRFMDKGEREGEASLVYHNHSQVSIAMTPE